MTSLAWDDIAMNDARPSSAGAAGRALMITLALIAAAAFGAWFMAKAMSPQALMPLETVRFKGDLQRVSERDLRNAVSPHVDGSWWTVDMQAIRAAVEDLAWVKAVAIRRVWPDALRLTITQHEPVALWGQAGLISEQGTVFEPDDRPTGLPTLAGPRGASDQVLAAYRAMGEELSAVGLNLVGLRLDERRSWRGRLASGAEIVIGRQARAERIERLVAGWQQLQQRDRTVERIDMRYPNGFAIRWADGAANTHSGGDAER